MKHLAAVAQLGERGTEDPEVAGSIPAGGTTPLGKQTQTCPLKNIRTPGIVH